MRGIYVPGPSNNHSSPALIFFPPLSKSIKSNIAFKRSAEFAGTITKGVIFF
jgi:hypothetical protein